MHRHSRAAPGLFENLGVENRAWRRKARTAELVEQELEHEPLAICLASTHALDQPVASPSWVVCVKYGGRLVGDLVRRADVDHLTLHPLLRIATPCR